MESKSHAHIFCEKTRQKEVREWMDKKEFLMAVQACRRKMNTASFLDKLVSALSIGAVVGILFWAAAFVVPLYYAGLYAGLALFLAFLTAVLISAARRAGMEQAALRMDSFGFEERIVTAHENLMKDGELVALQREDAMRQLRAHGDRIRIPILPSRKKILVLAGLAVLLTVLAVVPSKTKEYAKELHALREEIREKEDEVEEVMEGLEQLAQEELTPEQKAEIQDMIESLQNSLSEYQQASSQEMVSAASEKPNYKYESINTQLSAMAQSMQNGASVSMAAAESMEAMADRLREMSGQELASANGAGTGDSQGSQNGNGGTDGQGDGSGNGDGQGDGNGNGQGDGDGDGSGNGNGQGDGDGKGQGNGRGTGSSSTPHDYVSIPNAIADSGNLTGNAVDHDDSEYFYAQNGLSWEGTHMSHEAVIGSYEQNAYDGIAAGKYPSGMEDVIKEYFSSFNR